MRCIRSICDVWLRRVMKSSTRTQMSKRTNSSGGESDQVQQPRRKQRRCEESAVPTTFERASLIAAAVNSTRRASPSVRVFEGARSISLTDDGASWIYHVPGWYRRIYEQLSEVEAERLAYSDWFNEVWDLHPAECGTIKLFGKPIRTPRYQQAFGVTHHFSGATFDAKSFPEVMQHLISLVQGMLVDPSTGKTCLHAGLLNWYADGDHYMGPHSDEGVNIHKGSPVFSITLGPAVRRFVFTPRESKRNGPLASKRNTIELELGDGDLLIMGGSTQQTHKHALPKMKKCKEKRVNVTLRYFK